MKRRNFTQSALISLGISSLPLGVSLASSVKPDVISASDVTTTDGLKLKLVNKSNPTKNKDKKQFILIYDVEKSNAELTEKIYELKLAGGKKQQVFMTPVNENQLQAIFNWRLNA
jgi:hypothetical protein